jgi:general nucleoside transport system permease protein
MALFTPREKPLTSPLMQAGIVLGAVALALLAGAGLMLLMGASPILGYRELALGMVGSKHSIAEALIKTTPLLIMGLGIAIAFQAGVWNIGAEGQFYMGALFCTGLVLALPGLPWWLLAPLAIAAALTGGAFWGGIVGYLRARFGINEIIVSVMLNYVAVYILQFAVQGPLRETKTLGVGFPRTDPLPEATWLPRILPGTRLHTGFLVALLLAVLVYFLLRHTVFGYHIRAVGRNQTASRYAGIAVGRVMIGAMLLSGALAGFAGYVEVFGVQHRLLDGISAGYGFIAIIVALLGRQNPFGIVLASVLLAALDVGAGTMQRGIGIPVSLVVTIEYLTVILVVGAGILRTHYFEPLRRAGRGHPREGYPR